jgi:hypothetical protein
MDQTSGDVTAWAEQEFGSAALGDTRRTRRVKAMAAELMNRPAGQVTAVFEGAAREGAFRLLENDEVDAAEIGRAAHRACAERSAALAFVFAPIDGTSLRLTDRDQAKNLGSIGARHMNMSGVQVMTAIAVSPDGTPIGICGQHFWMRGEADPRPKAKRKSRSAAQTETAHWINVAEQSRSAFAEKAPQTKVWFQLDRGGDAWPVLLDGLLANELFTVRAAQDRTIHGTGRHLWETLEAAPVVARMDIEVGAREAKRRRRTASVEIRAQEITLQLRMEKGALVESPPLYGVLVHEPAGTIEWLLLTSHPVKEGTDAELVVFGYAQRWRIEEFHKAWKSGACKVEKTQLRDGDNVIRWATILASVAIRIVRLTYLARHRPELPATEELSRAELDAVILASHTPRYRPGDVVPMALAVDLLARVGGYTGKSSGGPPGAIVLARGLLRIEALAEMLAAGLVAPTGKM